MTRGKGKAGLLRWPRTLGEPRVDAPGLCDLVGHTSASCVQNVSASLRLTSARALPPGSCEANLSEVFGLRPNLWEIMQELRYCCKQPQPLGVRLQDRSTNNWDILNVLTPSP